MKDQIEILDVTPENVNVMPCCGIKNLQHEGHKRKVVWLKNHFGKGLKAKVLMSNGKSQIGYIEYLPGQYVFRGVDADGYMFIHCLWTFYKKFQNQGWGMRLIECAIKDAQSNGMNGVAVLTRQKPWLADSRIYLKCGFEVVERRPPDYELLVIKFRPESLSPTIRKTTPRLDKSGLLVIRSGQCPHTIRFSEKISDYARRKYQYEARLVEIETFQDAQDAPTPYAVFSIFYDKELLTDHQISQTRFRNIMRKRKAESVDNQSRSTNE
jgi:uncharacterized beta-barrel protein YwiB (DUF1934 family)